MPKVVKIKDQATLRNNNYIISFGPDGQVVTVEQITNLQRNEEKEIIWIDTLDCVGNSAGYNGQAISCWKDYQLFSPHQYRDRIADEIYMINMKIDTYHIMCNAIKNNIPNITTTKKDCIDKLKEILMYQKKHFVFREHMNTIIDFQFD